MDGQIAAPTAPRHPLEAARLEQLRLTEILDTPADPQFDDITALAAYICDAPVALVSLVDENRQWFKSHHGLDLCETDLTRSVCAHTILGEDVLIIEDTEKDPRTAQNPLVTRELMMRFYAGVPLIGRDGLPYGSLCVIDLVPRRLAEDQVEALVRLARQTVTLLEAQRGVREREEALALSETLKAEIDHRVANSLQQVAVLLRQQARNAKEPEAIAALELAQQRVLAVSSLHRTISALSDGSTVDLSATMSRLAEEFRASLPDNITLDHELPSVTVSTQAALPLALILNEFLTNSQKYAFPDQRPGRVWMTGEVVAGVLHLELADDGVGWPADLPGAKSTGIGMRVIEASVESLSGEMSVSGTDGCRLRLKVPLVG